MTKGGPGPVIGEALHVDQARCFRSWPTFTAQAPLRVIVSGCLAGRGCGVDGTSYGGFPLARRLLELPNVCVAVFCPEDEAFGTPRATPDLVGGDGFDVLGGRARVVSDAGDDWTTDLVRSALKMKDLAIEQGSHLALLMDTRATCGSTVIHVGPRRLGAYRRGPGVAAAAMMACGIAVVSQRDERTLALVFAKLGVTDAPFTDRMDHHERAWYRTHLG